MPGTLYVVSTPIGNLEDTTFRSIRVLGEVAAIACEDTRTTRRLLDHYGIKTPCVSYHEHNEAARSPELVERMESGESLALVTDAGTPVVSDPGFRLVSLAAKRGIPVVPIPGPSAVTAALAVSALPPDRFLFCGFPPRKPGERRRFLEESGGAGATMVFYEAPHRVLETLQDMVELLADPEVAVARELTKIHEEVLRGKASEVMAELRGRESVRGEFTIVVEAPRRRDATDGLPLHDALAELEAQGVPRMDAIKALAKARGLPKREVYRQLEAGPKSV
jgi:16S rRNA (cytidine1402-2'-O)-methyltransferase